MRTIIDNVVQIDPVLGEDGRNIGFYCWDDDDEVFFFSVGLPMQVSEDAFEDLLVEWRQLGWELLMREA
ncbi:hypothetical protein [Ensifer sp. 22460]|uniref:hypothetical protein n=1 Tax=Ensifer sp. 22460 TaxID=3453922 RepID=UPI003F858FD2